MSKIKFLSEEIKIYDTNGKLVYASSSYIPETCPDYNRTINEFELAIKHSKKCLKQ
jgi:hypothetical protein